MVKNERYWGGEGGERGKFQTGRGTRGGGSGAEEKRPRRIRGRVQSVFPERAGDRSDRYKRSVKGGGIVEGPSRVLGEIRLSIWKQQLPSCLSHIPMPP